MKHYLAVSTPGGDGAVPALPRVRLQGHHRALPGGRHQDAAGHGHTLGGVSGGDQAGRVAGHVTRDTGHVVASSMFVPALSINKCGYWCRDGTKNTLCHISTL